MSGTSSRITEICPECGLKRNKFDTYMKKQTLQNNDNEHMENNGWWEKNKLKILLPAVVIISGLVGYFSYPIVLEHFKQAKTTEDINSSNDPKNQEWNVSVRDGAQVEEFVVDSPCVIEEVIEYSELAH